MTLYDTTVDMAVANSSHTQVVDLVGPGKTVLDIGCSTGYVARALIDNGCSVSGVEYNAAAAEVARPFLEKLVIGDVNTMSLEEEFAGATFDSVIFADVLEHLADPAAVLRSVKPLLAPGGSVVISIPHVGHGSLRLALLQGAWRYRDTGLLDRTHIHFYTLDGLGEMLAQAGMAATEIRSIVLDPLGVEVVVDTDNLPTGALEWVRAQPEAYTYQYVLTARPADEPGVVATDKVTPAVDLPDIAQYAALAEQQNKINARNAELASAGAELRHQMLIARDNAVGLEAAASRARLEATRLRDEIKALRNGELKELHADLGEARDELVATHERLRLALDEVASLRQTSTWKLGRALLKPLHILRGGGA